MDLKPKGNANAIENWVSKKKESAAKSGPNHFCEERA
jgi:hypothetical protein